jgi:predicted nucleotidyltransferase
MPDQQSAIEQVKALINELRKCGYNPIMASLFGSVAKGTSYPYSDIDVAIWDDRFTGVLHIDYEPIKSQLRKFKRIELHTFNTDDTAKNNPFVKEIFRNGIQVEINN